MGIAYIGSIMRIALFLAFLCGIAGNAKAADSISLEVDGGRLYGSLEIPKATHRFPVALIISGSGPTDRDGNNALTGNNNSLKKLAEGLADRDVASIRYDKRGVAESAGAGSKKADFRFEIYIEDAKKWGNWLLQNQRFSQLIVIGHSEGALIGAVTCRDLGARGFISIAGAGYPAFEIIETQLKENLPSGLLFERDRILDHLKAVIIMDKVPLHLMAFFRPTVQPYLTSWFRYDPIREVSKIRVPSLIVQGTTDIQLNISNAKRLAKSNGLAQLSIIKGMNHVLKIVPMNTALQIKSYDDPDLPISQELVDKIAAFIKEVSQKK